LAVGIEREWSGHATGPEARFAGARTFLLLGLSGCIAGLLTGRGNGLVGAALLAGAAALAVTAYAIAARRGNQEAVDGTTEAAALVVLGLGAMAGFGELRLSAATGAVVVLALREKSAIQGFVRRLGEVELRAALQFAVLALVLLPILPPGPYGPVGGIRPRELWFVVLLVSGLNFAGYLARRAIGETKGVVVAGILGGVVSSTAVSLSFARQSRERPESAAPLALGVLGACTVLFLRLVILTLALRPVLTPALTWFFLPPLLVGLALFGLGFLAARSDDEGPVTPEGRSPLRLGSAIMLAIGFQAVLMAFAWVRERFGTGGILTSASLLGLTDMDALTLAMSRLASEPDMLRIAALAMALGVLSNTLVKLGVVVAVGAGAFRRRAGLYLLCLAAATGLGIWLGGD
jgi:uncharacterized membrane protein (DUF4010 family)